MANLKKRRSPNLVIFLSAIEELTAEYMNTIQKIPKLCKEFFKEKFNKKSDDSDDENEDINRLKMYSIVFKDKFEEAFGSIFVNLNMKAASLFTSNGEESDEGKLGLKLMTTGFKTKAMSVVDSIMHEISSQSETLQHYEITKSLFILQLMCKEFIKKVHYLNKIYNIN